MFSKGSTIRRRWSSDEEEALRRAVQKVGPGNWKEIKELEPMLINRSTVQIKDKVYVHVCLINTSFFFYHPMISIMPSET